MLLLKLIILFQHLSYDKIYSAVVFDEIWTINLYFSFFKAKVTPKIIRYMQQIGRSSTEENTNPFVSKIALCSYQSRLLNKLLGIIPYQSVYYKMI